MFVLSALTLEVVPGMAVSDGVTEPELPLRPESGRVTAEVPLLCAKSAGAEQRIVSETKI